MTQNIITAGGASDSYSQSGGNDGTLLIQTGPSGSKVNALTLDASGNMALLGAMTQAGIATPKVMWTASQATTSGTSVDFTSIPSWARKITVLLTGFSAGASLPVVQLGTSGGIQTTSYVSGAWQSNITNSTVTTGILMAGSSLGADTLNAALVLYCTDTATGKWLGVGTGNLTLSGNGEVFSGSKTLSGTLDRVRVTTVSGDTLDAGSAILLIEGY